MFYEAGTGRQDFREFMGTFPHVEFGEEVANITARQVVGYYDFCPLRIQQAKRS